MSLCLNNKRKAANANNKFVIFFENENYIMPKYTIKKDLTVGKRFVKILEDCFPGKSRQYIADKMGVLNEARIRLFEAGSLPDTGVLRYLDALGYSVEWLLINKGEMKQRGKDSYSGSFGGSAATELSSSSGRARGGNSDPTSVPGGKTEAGRGRQRQTAAKAVGKRSFRQSEWWENALQTWEIRGTAAANAATGSVVYDTGYADAVVTPPEGLTLVKAEGDSMSPLLLNGQYAMIDKNREGFETNGGVVVAVMVDEEGNFTTRIKRCYDLGGSYEFYSINSAENPPFTMPKERCRIWPVIGVWFAGHGKPPQQR